MRRVKSIFIGLIVLLVGGLLHYALPQHDIVRVTSTEVIRTDFNWLNRPFYAQADSGASELQTRDLRLINTSKKRTWLLGFVPRDKTQVMVYRNEDTGWIWPPYFKFDSADLQAESAALIAPGQDQWAVMTHYGWRNRYLSIYPNAIGIRPIDGPNVTIIPWFNIIFFVSLIVAFVFLRAAWRQFRERTIDPTVQDVSDRLETVGSQLDQKRGRFRRWLDTWRSKN